MRLLSRILLTVLIFAVLALGTLLFLAKPLMPLKDELQPIPLAKNIPAPPLKIVQTPALVLFYSGGLKSYYEPCGCQANMLGGLTRVAAIYAGYLHKGLKPLPIDAGNIYFRELTIPKSQKAQVKLKAEFIADMMRLMRYRVAGVGPFDLVLGVQYLKKLTHRAKMLALSANLVDSQSKKLIFPSHAIVDWQGEKIGFFALTGKIDPRRHKNAPKHFFKRRHLALLGNIVAARKAILALKKEGATKIIFLSTLGSSALETLVDKVSGIDIAIEGDEENEYPPTKRNGSTFLLSTPKEGQKIGVLALYTQKKGAKYEEILTVAQKKARLEAMKDQAKTYRLQAKKMRAQGALFAPLAKVYEEQAKALLKEVALAEKNFSSELRLPDGHNGFLHFLIPLNGKEHFMAVRWQEDYQEKVREANIRATKAIKPIPKTEDGNYYVGAKECATCHKTQYAFWKRMKHAKAYSTLVKKKKQFDQDCVGCHVVGWQEPGGMFDITKPGFHANVQCENCHGYGALHSKDAQKTSVVVRPVTEKTCRKCHTGSHDPHFDFYKKIQIILGKGHGEAYLKKLLAARQRPRKK